MDRSSLGSGLRSHPVRTCVGCRERSPKSDLLRLVVAGAAPDRVLVPDPRGTAPGRGAHLHPTVACLDKAERRRAFSRALRGEGPLDTSALRAYVEQAGVELAGSDPTAPTGARTTRPTQHHPDAATERAEPWLMNRQ